MNQEIMLERIAMLLSRFSEEVKILNFNGEFSINVHAENALIKLLNAVFECELENVNYVENKQFPSIDLRDNKRKIAIQVTADESLTKVLDCLNKFLKFNLNNDYDELYIVMLVRKQKSYSQNSIDKARKAFKFSQNNILEIKDLYAMLSAKNDIDTIKTVLKYLEMQFSDQIAYEAWKKYTSDLREYDKSIARQFEYVDISGYSPKINTLQVKVSLNDLYVYQLLGCDINNQQYFLPISHLLVSERKAVVLGNPGAGKSTLLKWFMFDICTHREQYSTEIPVYIKCAIYAKKMMAEQIDLSSYILNDLNLKNQNIYREAILNGYLVVLLDGLDEIGDISLRHDVVNNINLFVAQNPRCRVIVTSRKIGYNETRLDSHFNHYELLPFNGNQIDDFIKNWYRAVECNNYDEENVKCLIRNIRENGSVYELAKTPLLLMVICLIQYQGISLPENRIELYDIATATLLENWVKKRSGYGKEYISKRLLIGLLSPIAFYMQGNSDDGIITETDFREKITQVYSKKEYNKGVIEIEKEVDSLINYIKAEAGFLREVGVDERGVGQFSFIHLTFQEYFAAIRMASKWQMGMEQGELEEYVLDPHWSEVMILTAEELYMTGMDIELGSKLVTKFIENILEIEDSIEIRDRPFLLVSEMLQGDIVIHSDVVSHIVDLALEKKKYLNQYEQLVRKGSQKTQFLDKLIQKYIKNTDDLFLNELMMEISDIPKAQSVLMNQLKEDKLENQRNLFTYSVVYPVAPISKTIEFRNSITRFVNNNELKTIPTQYIISYVDDEKEVEKAYQVLEAVKAIENHELRQELAEEVLRSVIWKDIEDMEQYLELLKSELKDVDRVRINSYIKKKKINQEIENGVKDALHIIEKYHVFSVYYSKESNGLFIINDGKLSQHHIPFISTDELNLSYIDDMDGFAKFINCVIDFIRDEKVVFKSVDDFNLYVKYCDMVTWETAHIYDERIGLLDYFFNRIEVTEENIRKYLNIFSDYGYRNRLYNMYGKDKILESIIYSNLHNSEKIRVLSCVDISRKYRKAVSKIINEYLKSENSEKYGSDYNAVHTLMQRI